MKGELTVLRCLRIAEILDALMSEVTVTPDVHENIIVITRTNGTKIVVRPISIEPIV